MKLLSFLNDILLNKKPPSSDNTYDYYNKNTFWNDHYLIREYLNELSTGNKDQDWMNYLYNNYFYDRKNINMLSLVCGNGWQDRALDKIFNFSKIIGYDISEKLLLQAKVTANNLKYKYYRSNLNTDLIRVRNIDLAINLAGLHHIENMDFLVRQVYQAFKPGGIFAHFDYIGPKRNQYSDTDLKYMNFMQRKFPSSLTGRTKIVRPDLNLMLAEDPSEAVGSENIIPTLKKYFSIDYLRYLNGGMLYQVLYNHIQNFKQHYSNHDDILLKNIKLEKKLTSQNLVKPFFAFIICIKK